MQTTKSEERCVTLSFFSAIIPCRWLFTKAQMLKSQISVLVQAEKRGQWLIQLSYALQVSVFRASKSSNQPVGQPTNQPVRRPRVPLVPLKNHGKRMFSALFCPDYIWCEGNGGTLGACQPCSALGRGGGRWWAGGDRARGNVGDGGSKHEEEEGGRHGNETTVGGQRTSRDQKVGRGAAKFIKTSERKRMDVEGGRGGIGYGPEKDRWYITWQDFFFF